MQSTIESTLVSAPNTVGYWLNQIEDKEIREKALANLHQPSANSPAHSVSEALMGAFYWTGSAEGESFWISVHSTMMNAETAPVSPAIRHASSLTDFIRETNGRFFSVQAVRVDGTVSSKKNGHKTYKRLLATPAGQAAAKTAAQLACQIFTDNNKSTKGQEKRGAIRSFRKGNVISFKCGDLRYSADEKEVQRLRNEMAAEKRAKRAKSKENPQENVVQSTLALFSA